MALKSFPFTVANEEAGGAFHEIAAEPNLNPF
jgi:hypothetical protein